MGLHRRRLISGIMQSSGWVSSRMDKYLWSSGWVLHSLVGVWLVRRVYWWVGVVLCESLEGEAGKTETSYVVCVCVSSLANTLS